MTRLTNLPTLASAFIGTLLVSSCSGGSDSVPVPRQPFGASTGPLIDGAVWQLNRPIDIVFDEQIDFNTVTLDRVVVERVDNGVAALGIYGPGVDAVTGLPDSRVIRFQPNCPFSSMGVAPGLEAGGVAYRLIVRGEDTSADPVRSATGEPLESTIDLTFTTPTSSDPATVFFDPVAGAPRLVVRGRAGVPMAESAATRIELGTLNRAAGIRTVALREAAPGTLEVDPDAVALVPSGLPLNHQADSDHRVVVVVELDQPVRVTGQNLARVRLEYLDARWKTLPARAQFASNCSRRGAAIRLEPIGMLPPGAALRISLDAGFADLTGEAHPVAVTEELLIQGATGGGPEAARVDAIIEHFTTGAQDPQSGEDATSDLGTTRAEWGGALLTAALSVDGTSRARSKWRHLGLGGVEPGFARRAPTFTFTGTNAQGHVNRTGAAVQLAAPSIGPFAPVSLTEFTASITTAQLAEPTGRYAALPEMLRWDRLRLRPDPVGGFPIQPQIFGMSESAGDAVFALREGCYFPGVLTDCAPWNLSALFPNAAMTTVEVIPQSFEIYTNFGRDQLHPDARVTIRFDATFEGPDGQPDESVSYSSLFGFAPSIQDLSGTNWDFIRFDVLFELDVSGDGYDLSEGRPSIDFIKIPVLYEP